MTVEEREKAYQQRRGSQRQTNGCGNQHPEHEHRGDDSTLDTWKCEPCDA